MDGTKGFQPKSTSPLNEPLGLHQPLTGEKELTVSSSGLALRGRLPPHPLKQLYTPRIKPSRASNKVGVENLINA